MSTPTTNDGGPAFPVTAEQSPSGAFAYPGMTLRDYFAAAALQGLLASSSVGDALAEPDYAKAAYIQADAMLAEREKGARS
jgi:hypothetical protein